MNKSKGNMYKDVTDTWNPLGGECSMRCSYCSTKRLKEQRPVLKEKYSGVPRIYEKELNNLGKGKFIFVCAQNDLFGHTVDTADIIKIHEHMQKYPDNKYLVQSKNTCRMLEFYDTWPHFLTDNITLCTTLETEGREARANCFKAINHPSKHITIEPIGLINPPIFIRVLTEIAPQQINIGANSNPGVTSAIWLESGSADIKRLIDGIKRNIPECKIVLKSNLKRLYNGQ
jgi:protein gp37